MAEPRATMRDADRMPPDALPIVEQVRSPLSALVRDRLDHHAQEMVANDPRLAATDVFGPRVRVGLAAGPKVFFEDHAEVPLFVGRGNSILEYRSLLLAGDGDVALVPGGRNRDFEAYCLNVLGLGSPTVLPVEGIVRPERTPLPTLIWRSPRLMGALTRVARTHGQINLIPYMGTGHVWVLAEKLARTAGCQVRIATPSPRLVRASNDKLWFSRLVANILGRAALPPSYHAHGLAALTGVVATLARRHDRVVVKVPNSSGSLGNFVLDCEPLRRLSPAELRQQLISILSRVGAHTFPLLVGVWDQSVISSPSVQLWIPARDEGLPVIEGIFEQFVTGVQAEFVGAMPSDLPASCRDRLASEAMQLAYLLQRIGYFGRCSFDAILVGARPRDAELHWIECNGRWGGVSIPLTLANRLIGNWARRPFVVVQNTDYPIKAQPFAAALELLAPRLYRAGGRDTGVVLLTPGNIERGTGLHFLAMASTPAEAQRDAEEVTCLLRHGMQHSGARE